MADSESNTAMGVVLGVLVAVILIAGAFYVFRGNEPGMPETNVTNIETPDVNIAPSAGGDDTGDATGNTAPAP